MIVAPAKYLNSPYGLLRRPSGKSIMNGQKVKSITPTRTGKLKVKFESYPDEYELTHDWLSDEPIKKHYATLQSPTSRPK